MASGSRFNSSAKFTRPADTTAYASGDLVANSTTAGSVVPLSFDVGRGPNGIFQINRIRINKSGTGVANCTLRVHLFSVLPTFGAGDNAAISISTGAAGYLGQFDVVVGQAWTDGAGGQLAAVLTAYPAVGTSLIYGVLEARGAYTPANAEVITVTLEGERD